jgi:tetratricopeptide (TPR) repeat protein
MREDSLLLHVKVLLRKGWILSYCGQIRTALEVSNQTIDLSATLGDEGMLALSLKLRGYMHVLLGQTSQADADFNQALQIHRRLDDREDIGRILNVLGENARMRGDYAEAVELYQAALAIGRELRHPERIIMYLSNLGGAQAGLGQPAKALVALREAMHLAQTTTWYGMPETYRFLAEAYLGLGDYQEACRAAQNGLGLARTARLVLDVGGNLRVLGQITPHLPAECFAEALQIHSAIGAAAEQARTLRAWAHHELRYGDPGLGAERLAQARALFQQLGMAAELDRLELNTPAD